MFKKDETSNIDKHVIAGITTDVILGSSLIKVTVGESTVYLDEHLVQMVANVGLRSGFLKDKDFIKNRPTKNGDELFLAWLRGFLDCIPEDKQDNNLRFISERLHRHLLQWT